MYIKIFFVFISLFLLGITTYSESNLKTVTLAGGCFWCMEPPFENLEGVISVLSGYTGGNYETANYKDVSNGTTDHYESIMVTYDPSIVSYEEILNVFWKNIDPTDENGQFSDKGTQYKTAIFYDNEKEKLIAEKSKLNLSKSAIFNKPIATKILPVSKFYKAETYHQDYYKKNTIHYNLYSVGSGRKGFLKEVWNNNVLNLSDDTKNNKLINSNSKYKDFKKPDEKELKKILNPLEFKITQNEGTERAFTGSLCDNKEEGIYVDIISGEPLFNSKDKFDSGTGWPSFTKPLVEEHIINKTDNKLFSKRTEVRSRYGDSHLGHVFEDGPEPSGLRYCVNSASLRFIAKDKLEEEGYGEYLKLFK